MGYSECRVGEYAAHEMSGAEIPHSKSGKGSGMKRKSNFSLNPLLSAFGAFVILCLFTAGICAALRRKLIA
jgi:hypothetical protein